MCFFIFFLKYRLKIILVPLIFVLCDAGMRFAIYIGVFLRVKRFARRRFSISNCFFVVSVCGNPLIPIQKNKNQDFWGNIILAHLGSFIFVLRSLFYNAFHSILWNTFCTSSSSSNLSSNFSTWARCSSLSCLVSCGMRSNSAEWISKPFSSR